MLVYAQAVLRPRLTPLQILQTYFGYSQFRPGQQKIINSILSQQDTLAVLPTGGGKSICFQVSGLLLKGTTLVISPLISLMQDQIQALQANKISATLLNSTLTSKQLTNRLKKLSQGHYHFAYLAPERLESPEFIQACCQTKINLIVVDEAHCVSIWGHDFRPSYQQISQFRHYLQAKHNQPITLAGFTATATPEVRRDIIQLLQLNQPQIFLNSFERTNLFLEVINSLSQTDKLITLIKLLIRHKGQSGIIYTATRQGAEEVAQVLNQLNFHQLWGSQPIKYYHGGQTNTQRQETQKEFISNQTPVIVATNAFGMGIDKPDIRFVIHYQLPASLENYYQEVGRAGRDQNPASCYLLFMLKDLEIQLDLIKSSICSTTRRKVKLKKLRKIEKLGRLTTCLTQEIINYFGEAKPQPCQRCSNCLQFESDRSLVRLIQEQQQLIGLEKYLQLPPKLNLKTLKLIELLKPRTSQQLLQIPGIGRGWVKSYQAKG
ncbi:MAG: RecQ family ATP-dependent DNA helicase [Candidatus Pacebacteria bacterium]|nr:RecQ family ATP-dependent DNA helicase [Candidatus Paceibacterota bacterium]